MSFSKGAVMAVFALVTIFTVVICVFAWRNNEQVPDALIVSFFGWFAVEGGALALLKIDKRKQQSGTATLKKENTAQKKEIAALNRRIAKIQKAAGVSEQKTT